MDIAGDLKFHDVNGDGKISADDRTTIGNPTQKFIYGFSVRLILKALIFQPISREFQGTRFLGTGATALAMPLLITGLSG